MDILTSEKYKTAKILRIKKTEISRIDFALCKQPTETLKQYYDRQTRKPDILMNGGFFCMEDGETCFTLVDEKQLVHMDQNRLMGIGVVNDMELVFGRLSNRTDWRDFISAYPVLIEHGKTASISDALEVSGKARRSILAYDNSYIYLIAVELPGMNFSECQAMLLKLGVEYAINLDGGGSTKILQNGKSLTSILHNRKVDNVVAIYLKESTAEPVPEEPKTIYRIQVGAFGKIENANVFRDQIRALPDTIGANYAGAYVRQINGLYKVQVGAYSIRDNAVRVVADLSRLGYNAFITT